MNINRKRERDTERERERQRGGGKTDILRELAKERDKKTEQGDATAIPLWLKTRDSFYVNLFYGQRQEKRKEKKKKRI